MSCRPGAPRTNAGPHTCFYGSYGPRFSGLSEATAPNGQSGVRIGTQGSLARAHALTQCSSPGPVLPHDAGFFSKAFPLLQLPFKVRGGWVTSPRKPSLTSQPPPASVGRQMPPFWQKLFQ